jgi:hypothetical protein
MKKPQITFFCELETAPLLALFSLPDMDLLGKQGARLSLATLDLSPQRAEVVRRLNAGGIPVVAWLTLPREEGTWFRLENVERAIARYREFRAWSQAEGLEWAGIGLEIRSAPDVLENLAGGLWRLLPRSLASWPRRKEAAAAVQAYRWLRRRMGRDNFSVESYQPPVLVDARLARSRLLQHTAGLADVAVDREVLLLERSGDLYGPGAIWSYGQQADALSVRSTGGAEEPAQPGPEWDELERDLRLAWVFTDHLYVHTLEGCVRLGYLPKFAQMEWDRPLVDPVLQAARVERSRAAVRAALRLSANPFLMVGGLLFGLAWFIRTLRRLLSLVSRPG